MVPRLTIVTISFNQSTFLRTCLESVISQKDDTVEFIVVDPGSTDGSREILQEYADDIDQILLEPDQGPADGLNKGFALATGDYGYFLNSDDFLLPGAVRQMKEFWDIHPRADVSLCEAWMVDGAGHPLRRLRPSKVSPGALIDGRAIPVQQGVSFKMEAFRSVGGFKAGNRSSWDLELLFDLALVGKKFAIGSARIGAFRFYAESLSGGIEGNSHQDRLIRDRVRMRSRLPQGQRLWPIQLARMVRNLSNPFLLTDAFLMRLAPSIVLRAWKRDLVIGSQVND